MTEEQAFALTNPDGGVYAPGAFVLALGTLRAVPQITDAFRTGDGMGWHEHDEDVFIGCEQFFRPGYIANLIPAWIPSLDGVQDKLRAGASVADIGCGLGASTVLLAQEYPNSRFTSSDYHDRSIELARKRASDAGVADRVSFEVATAASFSGSGYDLAGTFDCLHDMGDPLAADRHVRQVLKPDGTWMIVEPYASDQVAENMNPVGRVYYNASTMLCVANALSQSGGYALGNQAGRPPSGRSSPTQGSPGSGVRPRPRSTSCTKPVPDRRGTTKPLQAVIQHDKETLMTRKTIDCRAIPNDVGCTLAITGEPDELITAAAQHAVAVHGHTDSPQLRQMLSGSLTDEPAISQQGAFVQLIEFDTDRIAEWDAIVDRWAAGIGSQRTVRWSLLGTDRDRPARHVAVVEFPSYAEAMANSGHPATAAFLKELESISSSEPQFRNLDVQSPRTY